jgi:hypothetical protein
MSETYDPDSELQRLRELPIRAEEIGFAPEELLPCTKCGRANAPNRAECIYCGTRLEGSTAEERLDVHELENWEKGFNVVVLGSDVDDVGAAAAMLAGVIGNETEVFESILRERGPLPVARLESERHATILVERLRVHGVKATVIPDDALATNAPPIRLRGIEFSDDTIVLHPFAGGPNIRLSRDQIALIVSSLLVESKTESIEKRKRKVSTTVSETKMSSDETVIDLYPDSDRIGYRVPTNGFDFSCLGEEKSLLASENMSRLISRLRDFAPGAEFVDYADVRNLLEPCWPVESRKDALGFKRSGFGRKDLASVFTTNNSSQILKYSRLRRHLL